jgi:glutaminyl-peptide cyclotransferase
MALLRPVTLRRHEHVGRPFTQGLCYHDGDLWESTGLYGGSELRKIDLGAGRVSRVIDLPADIFGEGICSTGEDFWQLTWRNRVAINWCLRAGGMRRVLPVREPGWGMCWDGTNIITSSGTSELVVRAPENLKAAATIRVRWRGEAVSGLNDLTWSGGLVWANVYGTHTLVSVDLSTGEVVDFADCGELAPGHVADETSVMNGLAATPGGSAFLVTGKRWPHVFEVAFESVDDVPATGVIRSLGVLETPAP